MNINLCCFYRQLRLRLGGGLVRQGVDAARRHLLCSGPRDGRRAGLDPGGVGLGGRLVDRRLLAGERVVLGTDGVGGRRRGRRTALRATRNLRGLSPRRRMGEFFSVVRYFVSVQSDPEGLGPGLG